MTRKKQMITGMDRALLPLSSVLQVFGTASLGILRAMSFALAGSIVLVCGTGCLVRTQPEPPTGRIDTHDVPDAGPWGAISEDQPDVGPRGGWTTPGTDAGPADPAAPPGSDFGSARVDTDSTAFEVLPQPSTVVPIDRLWPKPDAGP